METVIRVIEALPWQIAVVLLALVQAVVAWFVYRRRAIFPAAKVVDLIDDFKEAEALGQEHTLDISELAGKVHALERDRRDDKERLDDLVTTNSGEHTVMTEKLAEIAEGVAEIRGWRSGRANGKA